MNQRLIRSELKRVSLTQIASVERAQKNRIYPAGTIYVQVSAAPKYTDDIWKILGQSAELPTKYAVLTPLTEIIPSYLTLALRIHTAEWQARYVGEAINISMDLFQFLQVDIHTDIRAQMACVENIKIVDALIECENQTIEKSKEAKDFFLQNMFPAKEVT